MSFMLYSITSAIDSKYVVVKPMKGQVPVGSLIHVMDAKETSDGITIQYRPNKTTQNNVAKFDTVKQFCEWCMPSVFIARYYDKLSHRDIMGYIKAENRSFLKYHLPAILTCLVLIWAVILVLMSGVLSTFINITVDPTVFIIIGCVLSVLSVAMVFIMDKVSFKHIHERLYDKVMT